MKRENKQKIISAAIDAYLYAPKECKSLTKIGKAFGVKRQTLAKKLRETGYEIINYQNVATVDEHIFDTIDTEEKAYWLGFIFADGNIASKEDKFEINLSIRDIEHMKKLKSFFKSSNCIRTDIKYCRFSFRNKNIWTQLNVKGCTPNKSLTLKFPNENIFSDKKLIYDFLRGYCDGDGCLYFNEQTKHTQLSLVGTKEFLEKTATFFKTKHCRCRNKTSKNWKNKAYQLSYTGSDARYISRLLYEHATIYLDRKYKKYENFCRFEEGSSKAKSSKIGEFWNENTEVSL